MNLYKRFLNGEIYVRCGTDYEKVEFLKVIGLGFIKCFHT